MKIIWKVSPKPTGRYRSFEQRGWPSAQFEKDGRPAARIYPDDESLYDNQYRGEYLKKEDVGFDLRIQVTIPFESSWKWVTLKQRVRSIKAAKNLVSAFYEKHPEYQHS